MDVKNKLGILDHIHPETQRKAAGDRQTQTQKEKSYIGLNCRYRVKTTVIGLFVRLGIVYKCVLSPVAFPGVADISVMDAVLVRLFIQEVKHVFNS